MRHRRPNRVFGSVHDEFWRRCEERALWMQQCAECQLVQWPPVEVECEGCESTALAWIQLSGRGQVMSWCTFERSYYDQLPVPWDTIVVELEEGPVFVSNPFGFAVSDAAVGMPVRVTFIECGDDGGDYLLPVFEQG